jgi:hypothetical protein
MVDGALIARKLQRNPLIRKICAVAGRLEAYKTQARQFYFMVILSSYSCPACGGKLRMTGTSECTCRCGKIMDPTLTFQKSSCCSAKLKRKSVHYACSHCHKTAPSRFLFDEKLFDRQYFCKMMRESRARSKSKIEKLKQLLADSRSNTLTLTDTPDLESIPGFVDDLNDFIQVTPDETVQMMSSDRLQFSMRAYRRHIYSFITWDGIAFSKIAPLVDDVRVDRIWRFITLIYMYQDREVTLCQQGQDIFVKKVYHEAYP